MLIDTHAHLWWDSYKDDLENVIVRAKKAGVEKIIVPGTDLASSMQAIELSKKYPGVLYAAMGIHPEELLVSSKVRPSPLLSGRGWALPSRSDLEDAIAIGEIGTDASTEELKNCIADQKVLFREQCKLAIEFDLPVIIHTRDSFPETWEVLSSLPKMPRGQFHCFSVDDEAVNRVVEAGFYVSFCGNIAYSKRVGKLVPLVPDDRLLLETDSPFMKPGERNEPEFVRTLAEKVAELRNQAFEKIEEMTTTNAMRLFHL